LNPSNYKNILLIIKVMIIFLPAEWLFRELVAIQIMLDLLCILMTSDSI